MQIVHIHKLRFLFKKARFSTIPDFIKLYKINGTQISEKAFISSPFCTKNNLEFRDFTVYAVFLYVAI